MTRRRRTLVLNLALVAVLLVGGAVAWLTLRPDDSAAASVTIKAADGTVTTVKTTGGTTVTVAETGTVTDLKTGSTVVVQGRPGSDGTVTATSIRAGGFGPGGRNPEGPRPSASPGR